MGPVVRCWACRSPIELREPRCSQCGVRIGMGIPVHDGSMAASNSLPDLPPELSARTTLDARQRRALAIVGVVVLAAAIVAPLSTAIAAIAFVTALYIASAAYRGLIFWRSLRRPGGIVVTDEEARALTDDQLPVYTVLVPAFREPSIMARLIESLALIEYPSSRLDIKLLLEEDDQETIRAAEACKPPSFIQVVRVPNSLPKTKPKACLVGLATARGELITIYDAEDRPDPLQLRRVVAAFLRVEAKVACIQAKLSYHNADQNLLTRWFTAEYALWFTALLPGLVDDEAPIPLGGTSNHFKRRVLESVGAWDPWNVTEDADLGIRLHRAGYRTRLVDSVTLEEANSDFVNWVKQRSRWYKGYLQTSFVHLRQPRRLWQELGPRGFFGFCLFVLGTPLLAMVNPVFWILTLTWFVLHPPVVQALFPAWVYYLSLISFAVGNFVFLYSSLVAAHRHGGAALTFAALLAPIYWAMMSIAAIKALVQLIVAPSFWEKTTHGLDQLASARTPAPEPATDAGF